jgi:ribosomal protein S18 acetylase RimI-like enzyme
MDGGPISVTEASAADAGAFAAFLWEAWHQVGPDAPGFVGTTDELIRELTTRAAIVDRLGGPDRRMFLAWSGNRVVGFSATTRIDAATVELAGIIVLQSLLGHGIGKALVTATVASCRNEGYRRMIVQTETDNQRAIDFYETQGFTRIEQRTEEVDGLTVPVWDLERWLE